MSANIDRRIVEMQFDNRQFEKGIKTSVESLEQLKKGLDLDKTVKNLDKLGDSTRSFDLSGINNALSAINNRFSTMGIIGMRVLQNLTDSAYNAGKRILKSLTIDPVKAGFNEYETQIGAIQTIMANTSDELKKLGLSDQQRLDRVNEKLDELNAYADKTIYNFTEMTRNIGTFTAAGVKLDDSVASIKGIANLAAVSGSNSEQASRAMYQLSQALSTGTVRLMDWNSVVNDVLWERRAVSVNKTLIRIANRKMMEVQYDAKSFTSNRTIPLSRNALQLLTELRMKTTDCKGFIFSCEDGKPLSYEALRYQIQRACDEAKVPYKGQHVFRHTFATNCYYRGCDVKILSKLLGHSDVTITYNVYIHLFGDALEEMRSVVG